MTDEGRAEERAEERAGGRLQWGREELRRVLARVVFAGVHHLVMGDEWVRHSKASAQDAMDHLTPFSQLPACPDTQAFIDGRRRHLREMHK